MSASIPRELFLVETVSNASRFMVTAFKFFHVEPHLRIIVHRALDIAYDFVMSNLSEKERAHPRSCKIHLPPSMTASSSSVISCFAELLIVQTVQSFLPPLFRRRIKARLSFLFRKFPDLSLRLVSPCRPKTAWCRSCRLWYRRCLCRWPLAGS